MEQSLNSTASSVHARRLLGPALGVIAGLVPIFAFFMPKATAPMMIAFAIVGIAGLHLSGRPLPRLPRTLLYLFILIGAWALVSVLWAIDLENGFFGALKLIGNLLICACVLRTALALEPSEQVLLVRSIAVGTFVTGLLLTIELSLGNPIYAFVRSATFPVGDLGSFWLNAPTSVLLLCILPFTWFAIRTRRRIVGIAIFAAAIAIALAVGYRTGVIALIFGGIVTVAVSLLGRRAAYCLAAITVCLSVILPILPAQFGTPSQAVEKFGWLPNSAQHRIGIWTFSTQRIFEHPWAGWGMNSARDMPGGKTLLTYTNGLPIGESLPLHPHNTVVQLWLELGVPGLLAYIAFVIFLFHAALRRPEASALICGEIIFCLTLANLSYGIWQAWWLCALVLATSLTIAVARLSTTTRGG